MTRVQADVLPGIVDWLTPRITDADIRLNVPEKWKPTDKAVLVVADDGGPAMWPIMSQHTVRLTAYADGRTKARSIVRKACGLLGNGRPVGVHHVAREMGTILDARDQDTGAVLASVLLNVTARTVVI